MIDPTTLAVVSGGAIVALAMVAGHYAFKEPRKTLHPLMAYIYGAFFCAGVSPALWAVVTGDWLALFVVWLMFGIAGMSTAGCYLVDRLVSSEGRANRAEREIGDGSR